METANTFPVESLIHGKTFKDGDGASDYLEVQWSAPLRMMHQRYKKQLDVPDKGYYSSNIHCYSVACLPFIDDISLFVEIQRRQESEHPDTPSKRPFDQTRFTPLLRDNIWGLFTKEQVGLFRLLVNRSIYKDQAEVFANAWIPTWSSDPEMLMGFPNFLAVETQNTGQKPDYQLALQSALFSLLPDQFPIGTLLDNRQLGTWTNFRGETYSMLPLLAEIVSQLLMGNRVIVYFDRQVLGFYERLVLIEAAQQLLINQRVNKRPRVLSFALDYITRFSSIDVIFIGREDERAYSRSDEQVEIDARSFPDRFAPLEPARQLINELSLIYTPERSWEEANKVWFKLVLKYQASTPDERLFNLLKSTPEARDFIIKVAAERPTKFRVETWIEILFENWQQFRLSSDDIIQIILLLMKTSFRVRIFDESILRGMTYVNLLDFYQASGFHTNVRDRLVSESTNQQVPSADELLALDDQIIEQLINDTYIHSLIYRGKETIAGQILAYWEDDLGDRVRQLILGQKFQHISNLIRSARKTSPLAYLDLLGNFPDQLPDFMNATKDRLSLINALDELSNAVTPARWRVFELLSDPLYSSANTPPLTLKLLQSLEVAAFRDEGDIELIDMLVFREFPLCLVSGQLDKSAAFTLGRLFKPQYAHIASIAYQYLVTDTSSNPQALDSNGFYNVYSTKVALREAVPRMFLDTVNYYFQKSEPTHFQKTDVMYLRGLAVDTRALKHLDAPSLLWNLFMHPAQLPQLDDELFDELRKTINVIKVKQGYSEDERRQAVVNLVAKYFGDNSLIHVLHAFAARWESENRDDDFRTFWREYHYTYQKLLDQVGTSFTDDQLSDAISLVLAVGTAKDKTDIFVDLLQRDRQTGNQMFEQYLPSLMTAPTLFSEVWKALTVRQDQQDLLTKLVHQLKNDEYNEHHAILDLMRRIPSEERDSYLVEQLIELWKHAVRPPVSIMGVVRVAQYARELISKEKQRDVIPSIEEMMIHAYLLVANGNTSVTEREVKAIKSAAFSALKLVLDAWPLVGVESSLFTAIFMICVQFSLEGVSLSKFQQPLNELRQRYIEKKSDEQEWHLSLEMKEQSVDDLREETADAMNRHGYQKSKSGLKQFFADMKKDLQPNILKPKEEYIPNTDKPDSRRIDPAPLTESNQDEEVNQKDGETPLVKWRWIMFFIIIAIIILPILILNLHPIMRLLMGIPK